MKKPRRLRRHRKFVGILPQIGQLLWGMVNWAVSHPQPVVILGMLATVGWILSDYARRSEAFRIRAVVFPPGYTFTFPESLMEQNIWEVNLKELAREWKTQQPALKQIRVIRNLPNTIRLEAVARVPIAQIFLDRRWHPVDREGFILPVGDESPQENLARLIGSKQTQGDLAIGEPASDEQLLSGLRVLERLTQSPRLLAYRVSELDMRDLFQIRFMINGDIEVRCGSEAELDDHLKRLQACLRMMTGQPLAGHYIDVRFQDPIVGIRS